MTQLNLKHTLIPFSASFFITDVFGSNLISLDSKYYIQIKHIAKLFLFHYAPP